MTSSSLELRPLVKQYVAERVIPNSPRYRPLLRTMSGLLGLVEGTIGTLFARSSNKRPLS